MGVEETTGSASAAGANTPQAFPIGAVFISVVSTNPATSLGYGTWSAIGAGKVLVGLDSGDTDFDTVEETGGAKTVAGAGSGAAPTISGSTATEAAHTHSVTSNVAVADHSAGVTGAASAGAANSGAVSNTLTQAVHTHTTPALTHSVTNNAVTSGAGSSHSHGAGTLAAS